MSDPILARVPFFVGVGLRVLLAGCALDDPSDPGALVRPTVDDDPALPALDVDDTRLHLEVIGPAGAPVIILLHGGPGNDAEYMRSVIAAGLADDHRVVVWDQRGTGLSRRHDPAALTMARYHADLAAVVDAVSPAEPVVLLGHSWGALYAAPYLASHPDRVRGAVLVNGQALTRELFERAAAPIDLDPLAEWLNDPLWTRTLLSPADHARADHALAAIFATDLPRHHNHGRAPNLRPGAAVFKHLNREWTEAYDWTIGLERFPREVLIVAGTADEVQGLALQEAHLAYFTDPTLVTIDGAGHTDPFTVRVDELVALVRPYLARVEAS